MTTTNTSNYLLRVAIYDVVVLEFSAALLLVVAALGEMAPNFRLSPGRGGRSFSSWVRLRIQRMSTPNQDFAKSCTPCSTTMTTKKTGVMMKKKIHNGDKRKNDRGPNEVRAKSGVKTIHNGMVTMRPNGPIFL